MKWNYPLSVCLRALKHKHYDKASVIKKLRLSEDIKFFKSLRKQFCNSFELQNSSLPKKKQKKQTERDIKSHIIDEFIMWTQPSEDKHA